jgi:hypothetical protein
VFHRLRQGFGVCIVRHLGLPDAAGFAAREKVAREALKRVGNLVTELVVRADGVMDNNTTSTRA